MTSTAGEQLRDSIMQHIQSFDEEQLVKLSELISQFELTDTTRHASTHRYQVITLIEYYAQIEPSLR